MKLQLRTELQYRGNILRQWLAQTFAATNQHLLCTKKPESSDLDCREDARNDESG